jgi:hypothetical protein
VETCRSLPFQTSHEHRGVGALSSNKDCVRRMSRQDPLHRNLIPYNSVYIVPP